MADFSMCISSAGCPRARDCYRAPESGTKETPFRQSWMDFATMAHVVGDDERGCPYFVATHAPATRQEGDAGAKPSAT